MSGQPLNVGVIGLGFMGRNHLRVYAEMDGVRVVAACDIDEGVLRQALGGRTVRPYRDYRQMLKAERLDAVSVAVPTRQHREVALAAMAAGLHVLVEKPIASTAAEGMEIEAAARRAGVKAMVGHVERFNPAVGELKRRLAEPALGRVYQVQARRVGPFQQRVRDVGVVQDLASHDIDVMRFLLGSEVSRLYGQTRRGLRTEFEDALLAVLEFENGVTGLLDVNWLTPVKVRQLLVLAERGMFSLDYITQELFYYEGEGAGATWVGASGQRPAPGGAVKLRVAKVEPLRAELAAFVAAIRKDTEPPVSCCEAIITLHLAEQLVESGRTGRPLEVVTPLAREKEA